MKTIFNANILDSRPYDAILFLENGATIKLANKGHFADQVVTKYPEANPFITRIQDGSRNLATVATRGKMGTALVTFANEGQNAIICLLGIILVRGRPNENILAMLDYGAPIDKRKWPPRFADAINDTSSNRYMWLVQSLQDAHQKVPPHFTFSTTFMFGAGAAKLDKTEIHKIFINFEKLTGRSMILFSLPFL
jgi:hypothetical protein